jgi:hypothetical protein
MCTRDFVLVCIIAYTLIEFALTALRSPSMPCASERLFTIVVHEVFLGLVRTHYAISQLVSKRVMKIFFGDHAFELDIDDTHTCYMRYFD